MTNRNYEAGRRYEYKIKKKLEAEGWTVLRSAGSHGFADLIAIKTSDYLFQHDFGAAMGEGEIKLIQCKTGKSAKRARKEVDISKWNGIYSVSTEVV